MTESRALARAAVVLLSVAAALLPVTAAHAALPIDAIGGSDQTSQAGSADDDAAPDDSSGDGSDDDTTATSSDDDSDAGADDTTVDSGGSSTDAGQASVPSRATTTTARPGKPRNLRARLTDFNRASVTWRTGTGATTTRYVVSLRSGRSGRVVYVRASTHVVAFGALKPRTRYTATVTAYGKRGTASSSAVFRTPSISTAVRQATKAKEHADRDLRLAKAARFG